MIEAALVAAFTWATPTTVFFNGYDVTGEIVVGRYASSMVAALGLVLAAASLYRGGAWRWLAVASAVLYLGTWFSSGVLAEAGIFDGYPLKWKTATALDQEFTFLLRDVLLPFMFLAAVAYTVFRAISDRARS
jgi:hypothetical protein